MPPIITALPSRVLPAFVPQVHPAGLSAREPAARVRARRAGALARPARHAEPAEVLQASQAGRSSRVLFEQATTLERLARQEIILEDTALLEDYARMRQEFLPDDQAAVAAAAVARSSSRRSSTRANARPSSSMLAGPAAAHAGDRHRARRRLCQLVEADAGMLNATTELTSARSSGCRRRRSRAARSGCTLALATVAHRAARSPSCSRC